MFFLEYCSNPEIADIKRTDISFSDDISDKFKNALSLLDNYIYLIDMFKIVESCSEDLLNVDLDEENFWKVTKVLLNYVSAIYSFKELAGGFVPAITEVTEHYYQKDTWYRFICDIRNIIIHYSVIATEYGADDAYICLEKIVDILNSNMSKAVRQNKQKTIPNIQRQIANIEEMKNTSLKQGDMHYYGIKKICKSSIEEILQMKEEVLDYAYENGIKQQLEFVFNMLYKENDTYQYVFIVNKENNPYTYWEPNYIVEDFYNKMEKKLGGNSTVFLKIRSLFDSKGYDVFLG